jgi:Zn-dependent membrane protease YugP
LGVCSPWLAAGLYAQSRIKLNVTKYSQVSTQNGITGAEVARRLLDAQGLHDVAIESTPGILSDHYDPRSKTLRLPASLLHTKRSGRWDRGARSRACPAGCRGLLLEARAYIVPLVQLASQAAPWLFIAGLLLDLETLTWVGIVLFGSSFVLALLTLPVEFNASARAKELLVRHGIIRGDEQIVGVKKVLGAAAWTYVAAAVSAIGVWLFYVFMLFFRGRADAGSR